MTNQLNFNFDNENETITPLPETSKKLKDILNKYYIYCNTNNLFVIMGKYYTTNVIYIDEIINKKYNQEKKEISLENLIKNNMEKQDAEELTKILLTMYKWSK